MKHFYQLNKHQQPRKLQWQVCCTVCLLAKGPAAVLERSSLRDEEKVKDVRKTGQEKKKRGYI